MATRDLDPLQTPDRPDEAFEASWRRAFRRRLMMIGLVFVVWTAGIQARLVFLQVVYHPAYLEQANDQHLRVFEPAAKRGDVLDRNGDVLAYSVDADTIAVNPRVVRDAGKLVATLCQVFRDCSAEERADLIKTIGNSKGAFAFVRRGVAPGVGARVAALKLPGVEIRKESRRYYPNKELAAHLLGFVGRDNNGLGGIEAAYESTVRGKKGRVLMLTDARHNSMESRVELEATAGASLELTIDKYLQYIAERELRAGVEKHNAVAGTLIALDPTTGEILALANYPSFNPNAPSGADPSFQRNRAVQDIYDPGSTFKIVTAAAAIEEKILTPEDLIETAPGYIKLPGRDRIDDEHYYGAHMTFHDVIVKSSNVGAIRAGWKVGAERLNRYVRRFGFGEIHAPDFRGVTGGIVTPPERLGESGLASVSMGYQIGVTPLQMAAATAAVANGGTLYEPHLVRAIIRDGVREEVAPKALREAISASTAAALTTIMEGVVTDGTAKSAKIAGYQVAGKTGTAQKIINGLYSDGHHVGSFTGFVPSRRPALTVLVVVDDPRTGGYYGGVVAAPIFQKFAESAMRHLGIPPSINPTTPLVVQANAALPARYSGRARGNDALAVQVDGSVLMPDVMGLGARDATRVLLQFGLTVRSQGDGVVVGQHPQPGTPISAGGVGQLQLDRPRHTPAGGGRQ